MVTETLAAISGDKFFAGIVLWNDTVIEAAPIVSYMKTQRWSRSRVRDYCKTKGWEVSVVWETKRRERSDKE